ncbi:MAG: bifunctional 23S rRNA (guanine(2069)-N(7))-methyltransferase RlmK/23S rRNA (guanine(2445)-N(2))-methyltransferase RlmL [Gammaproteobacteria bacterium]|nr:bifunctional 23S rRNA (guanine(2069)-N(7))-methyltransferase RlmK/23S rRNA (guanine(2445)-N(2))-methyltransferase RlmL [Gammaproteobacteria bacterium]
MKLRYFASAPRGFEDLLEAELGALGAVSLQRRPGGVSFRGSLETGYRICLWSRIAEHVLLQIADFKATSPQELYQGAGRILWREHLDARRTLAVTFVSRHSAFSHSHFAALKIKDAIVDQFRAATGARPSVDLRQPDLSVHAFAERERVTVSIDLSGAPLHRRGYRVSPLKAPVKETLAAGILMRAGWPEIAAGGGTFVDPMCGSGTFLIEAAWMAMGWPPGGLRRRFGFSRWHQHDEDLWLKLRQEAEQVETKGSSYEGPIFGYDADAEAITAAGQNLARAGLESRVRLETCPLSALAAAAEPGGLVVTNPPYGERLEKNQALAGLYRELGDTLRWKFAGYRAAILAAESAPVEALGIRPQRTHRVFNGPLRCRLLRYSPASSAAPAPSPPPSAGDAAGVQATDFANRLTKNLRRLKRWARRNGIDCYRVYDADVPEYALAIDLYRGDALWAHVQEYAPPKGVNPRRAADRLSAALEVIPGILEIDPQRLVFKRRERQRKRTQYQRVDSSEEFLEVQEAGCRLLVNLKDRIDTGLYLDHRPIRMLVREMAAGRCFLNLFAYTGAASVQAAAGGARSTLSVDMSATYSDWGQRNLALNGYGPPGHQYLRADCLEWIGEAPGEAYELVLLDPPTFSNSKRMRRTLDIQRDHVALIRDSMRLLKPDGILIFSNHARNFRMDRDALRPFAIEDISATTLPPDFRRSPRSHRCWRISHQ